MQTAWPLTAHKLSDDVARREVVVIQHPLSGPVPDYMSYERIWQHYDLGDGTEHLLTLGKFCNQIIHSFNWTVVCHEDGGLGGVFFSSDTARRKVLYFAYIDLIVMLLREVGYDNVVSMSMTRGGNGDWKVTSYSARTPARHRADEMVQVTHCSEGRFTQGVNLRAPRSEAVRTARG